MRSSSLYLAVRSDRAGAPVLIWPAPVPTARWAMKESSVSPERWLTTLVYPDRTARSMVLSVSDRVADLVHFDQHRVGDSFPDPSGQDQIVVTNRSSPINCVRSPNSAVSIRHPSQSSSARPSSTETNP